MKNWMLGFVREEDGQGMTEYGLILGGIAVIAIAVIALLTPGLNGFFTDLVGQITGTLGG
ncbi:Flp family type IVb pilin [Bacillus daqingensis]|uniref:Flp family type IVb pilin n=1 Tax=Bacillus daqingensis TaxID=872396 RepID=A0ABV9NWM3_9BACI